MDTKEKTRSGTPRQRSGPEQRSRGTAKRPAQAQPRQRSGGTQRQQSGGQRTASRSQQPRLTHDLAGQNAYAPQSTGQEQVFRPNQTTPKRTRPKDPKAEKRAQQRRRSAQRAEERKKQEQRRKNRPSVAYVQPKPFNLSRFVLQLSVVVAVVLAITMGLSVFFKVEKVVVFGNNAYSAWTVQEAAGIENGERLLSVNSARASGKITAALPYVEKARIGIKLPDTVNIYITEYDIAYAIQSQNGTWWLMTSGGKVIEQIDAGTANGYTKVLGVELDNPAEGQAAKAYEQVTDTTEPTGDGASADPTELAPVVTVTNAERLSAALVILTSLETNDVVGEAASVDVSSLTNIELWYGQRFQVKLGDIDKMDKKISWMKSTVAQRNDYEMGILDISFTTFGEMVGYTPLEQ